MSKEHIKRMGEAVRGYYATALQIEERKQKNSEIYREDIARAENAKLEESLQAARWTAETAISEAQEAGRADAEGWGRLSGSEITDDAKLLQMELSSEQFAELVERYKGNGTMSTMLGQYAERKNREAAENGYVGMGPYDISAIPTAERKAEVYDRFAMGARDLISRMDQDGTFGGGINSPMLKVSIEQFGEPSAFTEGLFNLI